MNQDKIKALAMELYKNEEVAIELANVIFGIRDGDYEPEQFEFKFKEGQTYVLGMQSFSDDGNGEASLGLDHGRYRKTREGVKLSLKRNQRANRLEMLVEYLGGLKEWVNYEKNNFIYYDISRGEYLNFHNSVSFESEKVYMTQECAEKVCELLNSGSYSLEGE
jgi:hypothetical protein